MSAEGDDRPGGSAPARASHYFAADPRTTSDPRTVEVVVPGAGFTLATDRGVFSHGRLDAGTALLLRSSLPLPDDGDLLDLGCGVGPIALTMAQRAPGATVWAVDVNRRARELCAANATRNGLANVRVAAPGDVPEEVRFATMWSNPPIRIGKAALHDLLATWLDRLAPDGTAALVVQKHLGADSLQRWLDDRGHPTRRAAAKSGYRVLTVRPRRPAPSP
jgi:16S rRNA (guanine1207-N2)-methyltransferase